jgi:hypothetical protein
VETFQRWLNLTGDDPHSGRPSVSKTDDIVAKVREVIRSNCRLTIHKVAEEVSKHFENCLVMKFLCKI